MMFKRLRCKHKNQQCLTNICGDYILTVSTHRKIYRSIWKCKGCGKIIMNEYLIKECPYINWRKVI